MAKKDEGYGQAEGGQGDVGKAVARELQKKAQEGGGGPANPNPPPVAYWRRGKLFGGVKPHEIFSFCSALSLLLECGLPLVKALNVMAGRMDNRTLRRSAAEMAKMVEEGRSFSDAASTYAPYLPGQFIAMVRAGEKTGKLGEMLARIAESGERVLASRRKLITMFIYPVIVIIVAIIVVAVVFGIIAKGFKYFVELNVDIPWEMKSLLKVGAVLGNVNFWIGVVIVLVGVPILYMIATRFLAFRLLRDRFLLRCPGIKHFVKEDLLANFGRVFSTMLRAGMPIQESLQAAHDTCRNEVGRLTIVRVQEAVRRGQRITPTLENSGIFPVLAYDLCAAGEEAGALDRIFSKLGDYYEQKLQDEAQMLSKIIQPALIILLALIVGFILVAFFHMWSSALIQLQGQVTNG
jgi:type IV pilus assembly protein PilC